MRLYEKPFQNGFAHAVFLLGTALKYPQFWLVNKLLSYWRETTAEREWRAHEGPCYERSCIIMLALVFGLVAMIALLPFTIIGYFLWLIALRFRNPFIYSSKAGAAKASDVEGHLLLTGKSVVILSLNTKLLPESRSRTFNLGHVCRRARQIASVIVHASTGGVGVGGKNSGEPSCTGKNSFMIGSGIHGDSISQVSYGYLDKSAAYGDNFSENRSLVSATAVDVIISGVNGQQTSGVPNGDSYSVGAGTGSGGNNLQTDQMTVASLRSVEGMWQRRAAGHEKTESTMTLKSDVPSKQLAVHGPGSSHTLESLDPSESRVSRISEPNPSTMSLSSRVQGIPGSLAAPNNLHGLHNGYHNGSAVLSVGSGSGIEPQPRSSRVEDASSNQNNQDPTDNSLVAAAPAGVSGQSSSADAAMPAPVVVQSSSGHGADLPSIGGAGAGASVAFSSTVHMPSDCPSADIVCLQEVADSRADQIVASRLLTVYPHILHSAKRYHGFKSCPVTIGNLVIASKYPILCARYHEQLTSFGKRSLLVAKLLLQHIGDQRLVAIVGNVYLKRNSALTLLESADFDEIVKWLRSFRNDAISSDVNDILALDVCTGYIDWPEDGALVSDTMQHEFFMSYISPTVLSPAGDALFGAELEPVVLYEAEVNQPESLNQTLFRYQTPGPRLSNIFRHLVDVAGETAPFALLKTSFLRYCRDTPDTAPDRQQQSHRLLQSQASASRGAITTAFAGLTPHLGLNASFQS